MIYIKLFLTFLKVGAFSFGGGYGMIAMIRDIVLSEGWMTDGELLNFIAVAESTPGPIAVNMATFVGSQQAGLGGALIATLGVVLPSFVVILIVAALIRNLLQYRGVKAFLMGLRPVVVGLVLATGATMLLKQVLAVGKIGDALCFDASALAILGVLLLVGFLFRKWRKKPMPPILSILIAAALGVALYL
ncbi:MAG: chromate transporter [Clostridia bacterium]|nr:chromate transporter [Clostridia bacterium]MBQ8340134.1 chromate transporter [Clostridia bacterium]